nr:lipopolysaccharide biosynthesis protein [uncultured Flavobacterium sp.]
MNLLKSSISGVLWTAIDVLINKAFLFIATLYFARQLGPEIFGILSMISVFITIGNTLVDSGMSISLVRTPNISKLDISSVFFGNLLISIVVYFVFYFTSSLISEFYGYPEIKNIIRVYCLIFIVSALKAAKYAVCQRNLEFRKITIYTIPSAILSVIIGVLLLKYGYGIWSVIWMYISQQFILTIIFWLFSESKSDFSFSKIHFLKHFNFGYKLTISSILNTSFVNLNNIIIGKFFPISQSGFYERAYSLNQYPTTVLTAIISKVSLPVLSKLQEDKDKVGMIFLQLIKYSTYLVSLLMALMFIYASDIIILILGDKWSGAIVFLKILSVGSVILPVHVFNISIINVYGRSDYFLKVEIIKKIFQIICLIICFKFGLFWIASTLVFLSVFEFFINSYFINKIININTYQQLKEIYRPILLFVIIIILDYFFLSGTIQTVKIKLIMFLLILVIYTSFLVIFEKTHLINKLRHVKENI